MGQGIRATFARGTGPMLKYKVLNRLGAGGMGEVFLAADLEGDRKVAVKILQSQYSASAESRDRFLREMKVCAALEHPNIIKVHDYGESDGTLYFVMDYVDGRSLKEVVSEGAMDVHDAMDLAEAVADALAYIHPRDLIHRDLKPANIMLDRRGRPVLLDFGLVKALSEVSLTTTGKVIGTPRYMAPEMMLTGRVDLRSDIYQLGCILYELVTGEHAVPGKTRKEVAERSLYEVPAPPSSIRGEIDEDLENLLLNSLEKSPEERYPDAPSLLDDIRAWKGGAKVPRRGSGKPARERPRKRHRTTRAQALVASGNRPSPAPAAAKSASASVSRSETSGSEPRAGFRRSPTTGSLAALKESVDLAGGMVASTSLSTDQTTPLSGGPGRALPPRPTTSASSGAVEGGRGSLVALGIAGTLGGLLLIYLVSTTLGGGHVAHSIEISPLFAGAEITWISDRPYPSRVEVWSGSGAGRVVEDDSAQGLLHRVVVRGLSPGERASARILLPEGETADPVEFTVGDLAPTQPEVELVNAFQAEVRLVTGGAPAQLVAFLGRDEVWRSSGPRKHHEIPVDLPVDGSSRLIRIEAERGPDDRVRAVPDVRVGGVRDRLAEALEAEGPARARALSDLAVPLRNFLAADRADPIVKASLYQALETLRDQEAAQGGGLAESLLPSSFQVITGLPGGQDFPAPLPAPLVTFQDQYQGSSPARVRRLRATVSDVPAAASRARGAAIGVVLTAVPRRPSVLRIQLAGIGRLSLYFGREVVPGTYLHRFDPRLLGEGGELAVECSLESLTGAALPAGQSLILSGLKLVIQY